MSESDMNVVFQVIKFRFEHSVMLNDMPLPGFITISVKLPDDFDQDVKDGFTRGEFTLKTFLVVDTGGIIRDQLCALVNDEEITDEIAALYANFKI